MTDCSLNQNIMLVCFIQESVKISKTYCVVVPLSEMLKYLMIVSFGLFSVNPSFHSFLSFFHLLFLSSFVRFIFISFPFFPINPSSLPFFSFLFFSSFYSILFLLSFSFLSIHSFTHSFLSSFTLSFLSFNPSFHPPLLSMLLI
jgi:hypothetical protein